MHKMENLIDTMATSGEPLSDDELVDCIITSMSPAFDSITGALTMGNRSVP
jgi:hypothetical protein